MSIIIIIINIPALIVGKHESYNARTYYIYDAPPAEAVRRRQCYK